ncbi:MAG: hypothetical protein CME02_09595 [Geminicoccus sp.]|nr:hypothetical protein [Geminicoccus sp.]
MSLPRLIYIMGLPYSGTTLLNFSISSNSKCIGLGEGFKVFDKRNNEDFFNEYCTCQYKYKNCDFWSKIERNISDKELDEEKFQKILFEQVDKTYPTKAVVDSSKSYSHLRAMFESRVVAPEDVKIIFIQKDIRAWAHSFRRYRKWKTDTTPSYYFAFLAWILKIRFYKLRLQMLQLDYTVIKYEELCQNKKKILIEICGFLGLDFESEMLSPQRSGTHFVTGNEMRKADVNRIKIKLDTKWQDDPNWRTPYALYCFFYRLFNVFKSIR